MARRKKPKKPTRPIAEVRDDLRSVARFLKQQADLEAGPPQKRLRWVAQCLIRYLNDRASSLEHAFGLVRPRGNQGTLKKWADRAAEADKEGLSAGKIADRHNLSDEKSVREGLKRGRKENRRTWIRSVADNIHKEIAAERRASTRRSRGSK